MGEFIDPLEIVWENILSRQPDKIRLAFDVLDEDSRATVIKHLRCMAIEEGWHAEQQKSALAALDELDKENQP